MIDAVFSLNLAEVRAVSDRCSHWTEYVAFERRGEWLVVEETHPYGVPGPRCTVWSRHEGTGEVVYDALASPCRACGGRGWHTAGGNDQSACGLCPAGEAWAAG